jgi:hypothetical protein
MLSYLYISACFFAYEQNVTKKIRHAPLKKLNFDVFNFQATSRAKSDFQLSASQLKNGTLKERIKIIIIIIIIIIAIR